MQYSGSVLLHKIAEICETLKNQKEKESQRKKSVAPFSLCVVMNVCGVGLVHQAKEEEVCSGFCACSVIIVFV